jgi:hypothetical protein
MKEVLKDDIEFVYKGALNNDRAESFLFMIRAFVKWDILELKDKIVNSISGFMSDSEKLLIKREVNQ